MAKVQLFHDVDQQSYSCDGNDSRYQDDFLMEEILENMNSTPLGQVLKKIASLPEIRRGKVLRVRRQIIGGDYEINGRLDEALDSVLEDLTS